VDIIKVMIVDDSIIYRKVLRAVLDADDIIEVVTQAVNGKLALPRIKYHKPDVVILDQEMPKMNGLETLKVIKETMPDVKVIMFSSHTVAGANVTLQALEMGALDFVTKPVSGGDSLEDIISKKLIPLIKATVHDPSPKVVKKKSEEKKVPIANDIIHSRRGHYVAAVLGISTGGPSTLADMIPELSSEMKGPLFIVQHMPPIFTKQLAERLNKKSKIKVVEAEDGMVVENGVGYIAPGGKHLTVKKLINSVVIKIVDLPPEDNCKPSVNILFRSAATVYGSGLIGVIMTGMGNDGFEGLKLIKESNGYVIGQEKESCVVYGMPAMATREGIVDTSLTPIDIAGRINFLLRG